MQQLVIPCFEKRLDEAYWLVMADWLEENDQLIGLLVHHVVDGWGKG